MGNFPRERLLDSPTPLLSILYMRLIFNTWIKLDMWQQRPDPQPVLAAALGPLACPIAAALGLEIVLT